MPVVYYALDNEFAAASGSNVNVDPEFSYFDHPPNSTRDLIISSNKGDDDPSVFELGDTYDISWSGHGGGSMEDATVIRSDQLGPGEGAVVFEGINSNTGELYQVVWSPGFDLEDWYWANGGGPSSPNAFWTSDVDPNTTAQYVCFLESTRVRTPRGWKRVENLKVGDLVETRDGRPQPINWIGKRQICGKGSAAPVVFSEGAIGNKKALVLSQQHRVMISSRSALSRFDSDEVLVPAKSLVDQKSVRIVQRQKATYFHLLLPGHEILNAEGCPCESLYLGKMSRQLVREGENPRLLYENCPDDGSNAVPARPLLTFREGWKVAQQAGLISQKPGGAIQPTLIPAQLFPSP